MKNSCIILVALAMMISASTVVCAAPYVSINMGAVLLNDSDYSDSGTYYDGYSFIDKGELSFDTGFGVTAAIGNDFKNGFRAEVEFGFRGNDIDDADGTYAEYFPNGDLDFTVDYTGGFRGEVYSSSLMFNGFIDLVPNGTVSPFIGAGVGFANIDADLDYYGSEDDNVFAYQFAAGMAFAVTPNMKIDLQYRYFATEDPDFYSLEAEYDTHNILVGLRSTFY